MASGDDAEKIVGRLGGEGLVVELIEVNDVGLEIAPEGALEGPIGLRGVKVLDHVRGEHAENRVAGQTGRMDNGFCNVRLAETGATQAEDIAVLLDEATVEELFDQACIQIGAGGEVENIESLDHAEVRPLEATLEASFSADGSLGTNHLQGEVGERRGVFLGMGEQLGQRLGEGGQVEVDGELDELFSGVGGNSASGSTTTSRTGATASSSVIRCW